MALVLGLAAAIWGIGWAAGLPQRWRWGGPGLLFAGVIGLHLALPPAHPLREATGGSAALWVALAFLAAAVQGYRWILRRLRERAAMREPEQTAPKPAGPFGAAELQRYQRHIMLREIGGPGQKALKTARVLVIGAGGLGSPVLLYLAAAGVGVIGVIDDDTVSASNLQRQIVHQDQGIGMPKVFSAAAAMQALNPFIEIRPYNRRLGEAEAALIEEYDLILDGSDNFATRYLVNRLCVAAGKPLISAAISQWEGQISLYDPRRGGPCYQCVFPQAPAPGLAPTCAEAGVAGPLPGVIGSTMALEAVKHLTGAGAGLRGRLMIFDGLYGETRLINVGPEPTCPICQTGD